MRPEIRVPVKGLLNCTVIARYSADGFYYPGKVDQMYSIRKVSIKFERLARHDVATRLVIPITGAVSRPHLMVLSKRLNIKCGFTTHSFTMFVFVQVGNYVLAKVLNDENGYECFVPGAIYMLPKCSSHTDQCFCQIKFYTVVLFNGQKSEFMRNHLIKISKMRYLMLCKYIYDINPKQKFVNIFPLQFYSKLKNNEEIFIVSGPNLCTKPRSSRR